MEPPSFLLDLFLWLLFWDQKQERKAQQQTSDQSTTTNSNLDTESHLASTNEQILAQYCNHNKFYHQLLSQIGKCALCNRMVSLWFAHHAGFENDALLVFNALSFYPIYTHLNSHNVYFQYRWTPPLTLQRSASLLMKQE